MVLFRNKLNKDLLKYKNVTFQLKPFNVVTLSRLTLTELQQKLVIQ
jgi:hypothetical protein